MKSGLIILAVLGSMATVVSAAEPARILLWESGAPGEPATKPADEPALFVSRPVKPDPLRSAVIICPGGAYNGLAIESEGLQVADWLNSLGITAFVLQYRRHGTGHRHPVPMLDGQRALRTVRARADEWHIDPTKVGVMGFSAGGHLASTLATHFDPGQQASTDAIDRASSRPNFLILCYPVITMSGEFVSRPSRDHLLGKRPDAALARSVSNELQVSADTPPTFIFQTDADTGVRAENCVSFYLALRRAGVPAEIHIYQNGRHGVGLARDLPGTSTWPDRLRDWMQVRGLLGEKTIEVK